MKLSTRYPAAAVAVGVFALLLSGCAGGAGAGANPAPTVSSNPERDALIEQARTEGSLDLTYPSTVLGGTDGSPQLIDGFKAYYGLDDLDVTYTAGPPFVQVAATLAQEVAAGQSSTSDIYVGYAPQFITLLKATPPAFAPTDWSWAENIPESAIGGDGAGIAVATSFPVITYNSAEVDGPPTSMADLLDPKWKGRIASTPYASNFHYFAGMAGQAQVLDYLRAFSKQVGGLIDCTQTESQLLSGAFDVFAFDCDQTTAISNERDGGPLRYVIPSDAAMLSYVTVGVPVNAVHPAAAQLWINYLMSRQAQDILWDTTSGDSTYVPGSHMAEIVAKNEVDGVTFTSWNLDDLLNSGKFPPADYIQKQVAILTGKG